MRSSHKLIFGPSRRISSVLVATALAGAVDAVLKDDDDASSPHQQRLLARPWYSQSIVIGGKDLFVSPLSIAILWISAYFLIRAWAANQTPLAYAVASHILLEDGPNTEQQLNSFKQRIGASASQFAKHAATHSKCPSKHNGGALGRFPQGAMAPPFDRAVFDPKAPLQTTIGPIQTTFGWHLIYIHGRSLPDKK